MLVYRCAIQDRRILGARPEIQKGGRYECAKLHILCGVRWAHLSSAMCAVYMVLLFGGKPEYHARA